MDPDEIDRRFGYHGHTLIEHGPGATLPKHEAIRGIFKEAAFFLDDVLPDGRDKMNALRELEHSSKLCHASVASTVPQEV